MVLASPFAKHFPNSPYLDRKQPYTVCKTVPIEKSFYRTVSGLANPHNLIPGKAASFAADPQTIKYFTAFSGLHMPTLAPDFRTRSSNKRETNILAAMRLARPSERDEFLFNPFSSFAGAMAGAMTFERVKRPYRNANSCQQTGQLM